MSRLPVLSTPGRTGTPPTGIPTPSARRPRSSLGPSAIIRNTAAGDDEMDAALMEALRNRPPSSIRGAADGDDPDTPTAPSFLRASTAGTSGLAAPAPRTPAMRARTPVGLGVGHAPVTPSGSRNVSRPSMGRPSLGGPSSGTVTPRRPSVATTPHGRRTESRMSSAGDMGGAKWQPVIGERVRASGMGMEGTLRFMGETEFKAGTWAGIELEGGFAGKGKNDGSVAGVPYFSCPPECGIFVLATKLGPPTSGPSAPRPESVASSYRAHSSMAFSAAGRETPAMDHPRPATTTPGRATTRTVSTAFRGATTRLPVPESPQRDTGDRPVKTILGSSTSSNAAIAASKITAGSRASKYLGMTAKQLESARSGTSTSTANANLKASIRSTAVTPRVSRVSMGTTTPARPRPSMGSSMATPRARPRASNAFEAMPPPPPSSPGKLTAALRAEQAHLEAEIRDLRSKNAALEDELREASALARSGEDLETLQADLEHARQEAADFQHKLASAQIDATSATDLATELAASESSMKAELAAKERELADLQKEMKVAEERATGELEAGMEAKRREVSALKGQLEEAQRGWSDQSALVEELSAAGTAAISLYEGKVAAAEMQRDELEDRVRHLEEKVRKAAEDKAKAEAEAAAAIPTSPNLAQTAAEIDNETLNAQIKHLQNKVYGLEEALEEGKSQMESDGEAWKARLAKSKEAEKGLQEQLKESKGTVMRLNTEASGAKTRIGELEGALKENQGALEVLRAEIEGLRADAAEASSLRAALAKAGETEKALAEKKDEVAELKERLKALSTAEQDMATYHDQVVTLEAEIASLRKSPNLNAMGLPFPKAPGSPALSLKSRSSLDDRDRDQPHRPRLSTGSQEGDESKMRGYHYLIKELTAESQGLREQIKLLEEEIGLQKEEIKLLEDAAKDAAVGTASAGGQKELADARTEIKTQVQTIKDLEREVSELESLIESKIYHQDDLENKIASLEKDLDRARASGASGGGSSKYATANGSPRSRTTSGASSTHPHEETRCELCEGPHDLDACPVFAGNLDGVGRKDSPLAGKGAKWCVDCESTDHDTSECTMAEEVF